MSEVEQKVARPEDLDYRIADAFNAGDVEAVVGLFEEGAIEWRPPLAGGDTTTSPRGIQELIEEFASPDTRMDLMVHHVTRANGLALCRSQWRVVRSEGGEERELLHHNGIEVSRQQPSGEWRLVIDHPWGADPSYTMPEIPRDPERR